MYYLADFAFENISDRALERIRERSILQNANKEQVGYKRNLNFKKKISRGALARNKTFVKDAYPSHLRGQLETISTIPTDRTVEISGIKTRKIGTKTNPLNSNLFPNTKTVVKKTATNTATKTATNVAKKSNIFGSKLFPYVAAPTAIIGGLIGVNKSRGKTWNGKDK